jgi:hypothetical protein
MLSIIQQLFTSGSCTKYCLCHFITIQGSGEMSLEAQTCSDIPDLDSTILIKPSRSGWSFQYSEPIKCLVIVWPCGIGSYRYNLELSPQSLYSCFSEVLVSTYWYFYSDCLSVSMNVLIMSGYSLFSAVVPPAREEPESTARRRLTPERRTGRGAKPRLTPPTPPGTQR